MMINKRLIGLATDSKKYVAGNVLTQWISLAANIVLMTAITKFLADLFLGTINKNEFIITFIIAII